MPVQEDYIVEAALDNGNISIAAKHASRIKMYIAIIGIVLINFVVLFYVRRRMKREIDTEVSSRV